ncbi:MAG TPA: HU family DNA-binding protein [Acidobacteriota bacterium]|nr:HU family DNA-binding protein [Acidobacteriota bacterium]
MNKNDISRNVYEAHGGLSCLESQKIVDIILDIIKERLSRGEKVLLSGFGCFRIMKRKSKRGVNPQTGRPVIIAGRNAITFKPSKYLKSI